MGEQPDNALLLYLHLTVAVVQWLGTDWAQRNLALCSGAGLPSFSFKNLFFYCGLVLACYDGIFLGMGREIVFGYFLESDSMHGVHCLCSSTKTPAEVPAVLSPHTWTHQKTQSPKCPGSYRHLTTKSWTTAHGPLPYQPEENHCPDTPRIFTCSGAQNSTCNKRLELE